MSGKERDCFVDAGGLRFAARQCGDRVDAVYLHGFAGDLSTWDRLWQALGEHNNALRYDARGFGRTAQPENVTFSHSEDLIVLMDTLSLTEVDLVGVSMGGATALNVALDYPQRVRRLILISPGLVGWDWSPPWRARWREISAAAREGNMDRARMLWWQHPLFATTRQSDAAEELQQSIARFAGRQWVEDWQYYAMPDIDRLPSLSVPTLLLSGGRDTEDFRLIADLIAGSSDRVVRRHFPDDGHLLQLERPQEVAERMTDFIREEAGAS